MNGSKVIETYLIRPNKDQRWYYISDQCEDEAWVFLQAGSASGGQIGKCSPMAVSRCFANSPQVYRTPRSYIRRTTKAQCLAKVSRFAPLHSTITSIMEMRFMRIEYINMYTNALPLWYLQPQHFHTGPCLDLSADHLYVPAEA
jgi:hypothetical protein